jgi:predicted nucleotidyltransferase
MDNVRDASTWTCSDDKTLCHPIAVCTPDDIATVLRAESLVRAAWVFGSVARGAAGPESDLDVAVLGERALTADEKMHLIGGLARRCLRPVDLIDLQATQSPVVGQVIRYGQRLFCDDETLCAEFMKRWVFDRADWIPYRERALKSRRDAWINR